MSKENTGFVSGTLVRIKDGLKAIEEIRIGDFVLSYPDDEIPLGHQRQDQEYIYKKVVRTSFFENQNISEIIVCHLDSGRKESLFVAPKHFIFESSRGWISLLSIRGLDTLEDCYFGNLMVSKISHSIKNATLYNFEVEHFETYYVGRLGTWVHT